MKIFLSLFTLIMLFSIAVQANPKDRGNGKGKGHQKHYYKKQKHYCKAHCRHGVHHVYREKVIIVQPAPRPGININLPL
ncbi:hypothetical protein I5M27_03200 [Adhaeribacter sp. BT258]|uniref:Uncharacterized protein n=1 Tax=Adhaeribacter terrigena TaxID=2793070 RepID=A0ABS1C0C8_9BACT|nr:hypothetical protein [Adhaeribacter terrigena]MBK0401975.1 hypothetical protein [Adhaeribacter terrigena]